MGEEKKSTGTMSFWSGKTPEELAQIRKDNTEKSKATRKRKRDAIEAAKKKAEELLPVQMANNMIAAEDSQWIPDQATVNAVVDLLTKGMDPLDIKRRIGASDKAWEKIAKVLFNAVDPNVQDVALALFTAKIEAKKAADKMVKLIQKEIRAHKYNQKLVIRHSNEAWMKQTRSTIPNTLLTQLAKATQDKLNAENDYARLLQLIGTHDKKAGSPTITIKTSIARPGDSPVVESVTETKRGLTLDDAIAELKNGS